jgi:Rieske Fe-S protein
MTLNRLVDSGSTLPSPDVQSTTFSFDALARFSCNTWDEILAAQSGGEFDVIVIGAGMYGAHVAAKLFELGRRMRPEEQPPRILVLESGPFLISEHMQNVTRRETPLSDLVAANLVPRSQTNIEFSTHSRCVGGKSLFWGGWAPRYQREDMARLDEAGQRLWPEEIEQYLFRTGFQGGYEYSEREIGAYPVSDFINGDLYQALKQRAEKVVADRKVPLLKQVIEPPLAVQGESPGSGLFSFDKFSSVPALLDSVREDDDLANHNDALRRLFLVPHTEVLKLETHGGRVHQLVAAIADPSAPNDHKKARVVRLNLKSSAMVVLAGNTVNSTRLALNSFPRPATFGHNGELMGRNLMYHTRSNYTWRVKRSLLELPPPAPGNITTAALHITGAAPTGNGHGTGQFHFQFYAAPNMNVPMYPGASREADRFLYMMVPNIEDIEAIREAQNGLGNERVVLGIRTVGETFGARTIPIGNPGVSWVSVNPYGGTGDDVYIENNNELRIPQAYVHMVTRTEDDDVWKAQDAAAFEFIGALTGESPAPVPVPPAGTVEVEVLATVPENQIPGENYRTESGPAGRFFIGRFGGNLRVLDGNCTHESCPVSWNAPKHQFDCPCHGAIFAPDGSVVSGPPPKPLLRPEFRVQNGKLEVIKTHDISAPVELVTEQKDKIGSTYHECGTLWLGTDPVTSVTDVNGRFHHVTNAYCVDQSLFPTAGSANPALTGITLTRKIAASIIDRYTSAAHVPTEAGFTSLYRGNFAADGWQIAPGGSPHFFDVAHPDYPVLGAGEDTPEPALGVLWYTVETFRDFIVRLDWLAYDNAANSGIFLRMPQPTALDPAFYDSSIEVQIDEHGHDHVRQFHGSPLHKTGAVYDCFPARRWAAKVIEPRHTGKAALWNSCEIRLQGSRIEVTLNGALVSHGEFESLISATAPAAGKTKRAEGYLGLQCHSEVVQFRNIRIQKL